MRAHLGHEERASREPWLRGGRTRRTRASAEEIEQRCGSEAHQGVCAEVEPFAYAGAGELLRLRTPLIVALDQVQDPQNLGAICRSAECAGAAGVVIPERRSAEVTAAVCKASAGAVEHLPIARVRNLADFLAEAKAAGAGATARSARARSAYDSVDSPAAVVLVLGSEGPGCGRGSPRRATRSSRSRCAGGIESLSVSAAAAVLLYAAVRRRSRWPDP